jgi:ATPase subunit of ABC transporter with duplicated ATPase domains
MQKSAWVNSRRKFDRHGQKSHPDSTCALRGNGISDCAGSQDLRSQSCNSTLKLGQRLWRHPLSFMATSGDRVRIKGPNGAGKSVLMRHLCGAREFHSSGSFPRSGQSDLVLAGATASTNEHRNLLQLANERLPDLTEGELRRQLGAYGYRGEKVFEPQANLSAGEKIRLQILLATGADTAPGFAFLTRQKSASTSRRGSPLPNFCVALKVS